MLGRRRWGESSFAGCIGCVWIVVVALAAIDSGTCPEGDRSEPLGRVSNRENEADPVKQITLIGKNIIKF